MKKNVYLWLCALVLTIVGLSSCSSDDEDSVERYALCHAWNWQDEMPKNYYDLIVYKLDGTIEVVQIIFYVAFQIIGKYLLFINCLISNSYTISQDCDDF